VAGDGCFAVEGHGNAELRGLSRSRPTLRSPESEAEGIWPRCCILSAGRISICGMGESCEELILVRVGERSSRDLWEGGTQLRDLRRLIPDELGGVCTRCMLKRSCLPACRALAYPPTRSVATPFGFCREALEEGVFPGTRLF
jgi:radical SAM protein with 4Fe4S-binding SPASM domain